MKRFGTLVEYVAVKNLAFGDRNEFVMFDGYTDGEGQRRGGAGKAALLEQDGLIMTFPKLMARSYSIMDQSDLTISDATHDKRVPLADRSRIFYWRKDVDKQLLIAAARLGIPHHPPQETVDHRDEETEQPV